MDPLGNDLHYPPNTSSWSHNQHLGVNRLSKPIRKPLLPPPPFQPQVYNISQSDFRHVVQQLTGGGTSSSSSSIPSQPPPPPTNPQVPTSPPHQRPCSQPSQRLQKIRPPPLFPMARPPSPPVQNPALPSPFKAYMRFLESSLLDTSKQPPAPGGPLPSPVGQPPQAPVQAPVQAPSPPPQFPSPTAYVNWVSQCPLLSPPGFHYTTPINRNLAVSPRGAGHESGSSQTPNASASPLLPLSPGFLFPSSPSTLLSPSNFFPVQSPIWRDH